MVLLATNKLLDNHLWQGATFAQRIFDVSNSEHDVIYNNMLHYNESPRWMDSETRVYTYSKHIGKLGSVKAELSNRTLNALIPPCH